MKQIRYLILAAVAVISLYVMCDRKSKGGRQPVAAEETVAADTVGVDVHTPEAAQLEDVARRTGVLPMDSGYPRWGFGELLSDLMEVYQIVQRYERGDSIDTARVIELERKLNSLTK